MSSSLENSPAYTHPNSSAATTEIPNRIKKKVKRGRISVEEESSDDEIMEESDLSKGPDSTPNVDAKFSYKDMLTGGNNSETQKWEEWGSSDAGGDMFFEEDVSDDEDGQEEQCLKVLFSKKEKAKMRKPWRKSIIVKLLGKVLGFQTLSNRIMQLWKLTGRYKVINLRYDYFLFRFEKKQDYINVLRGGHWIIGGQYLTVRQWSPNFNPAKDRIGQVIAWIIFPCLPMEYYTSYALARMGKCVGRVIKIDKNTKEVLRDKFARICVDIDLTKPLVSKILVGKHSQMVEYEGLHLICFHCGKVGHKLESCSLRECSNVANTEEQANKPDEQDKNSMESRFGP